MMHVNRRWKVARIDSAHELAIRLTDNAMPLCRAFDLFGVVFVNDSTSEGGAQEWAVLRAIPGAGEYEQLDSITFSWCSYDDALSRINSLLSGQTNEQMGTFKLNINVGAGHKCSLCA